MFYAAEAFVLLVLWVVAFTQFMKSPETIATHFTFSGEPDRMGPRTVILLIALIGTAVATALEFMALKSPANAANIPGIDVAKKRSPKAVVYARRLCHVLALLLLLMMISVVCLLSGVAPYGITPTLGIVFLTFIAIGYYGFRIARLG